MYSALNGRCEGQRSTATFVGQAFSACALFVLGMNTVGMLAGLNSLIVSCGLLLFAKL